MAIEALPCARLGPTTGWPYEQEDELDEAKVNVRNHGPLRIEGDFKLYDADGSAFDLGGRTAISLCRCGHSQDKPFCDGSHKRVGFESEVKARNLPPPIAKPLAP